MPRIASHPRPTHRPCSWCASEFVIARRPGRPRLYCNHACRQRAYEHRHGFEHQRTVRPLPAQVAATRGRAPATSAAARSHRSAGPMPCAPACDPKVAARNLVRRLGETGHRPTLHRDASSGVSNLHDGRRFQPAAIRHQRIERAVAIAIAARRHRRAAGRARPTRSAGFGRTLRDRPSSAARQSAWPATEPRARTRSRGRTSSPRCSRARRRALGALRPCAAECC